MKIDAHIHFTPPELKQKLEQFSETEPYWGLLLNPPEGRSIQGWADPERMIADMDAAGIDKVVIVGEYFRQHENCVARNNQAIDLVKRFPNRVLALATLQPTAGDLALDELKRCLGNGLHGVGELNPYAQGVNLLDKRFLRLTEAIVDADVPLNLHVSEEIGGYYLGKSTTPLRDYYALACRFPELKLILAHWGGGLLMYEMMPRVRKQLSRVWYDTAASPLLYPTKRIFKTALTCVSHKKILYGSDYPLLIYPSKMAEPDMRPLPNAIDTLNLEPDIYADIMGENAARLFGLGDYTAEDLPPFGSGLGKTQV
ncbi:MAG: amidohydrolase family protein, partial [Chloroflexota bacterium]